MISKLYKIALLPFLLLLCLTTGCTQTEQPGSHYYAENIDASEYIDVDGDGERELVELILRFYDIPPPNPQDTDRAEGQDAFLRVTVEGEAYEIGFGRVMHAGNRLYAYSLRNLDKEFIVVSFDNGSIRSMMDIYIAEFNDGISLLDIEHIDNESYQFDIEKTWLGNNMLQVHCPQTGFTNVLSLDDETYQTWAGSEDIIYTDSGFIYDVRHIRSQFGDNAIELPQYLDADHHKYTGQLVTILDYSREEHRFIVTGQYLRW